MYSTSKIFVIVVHCFLLTSFLKSLIAQDYITNTPKIQFTRRNLGGPRLGITYVPEGSELSQELRNHKIGSTLSQFGWHFEYQVIPKGYGPSFVIQIVPLVAGVEYGKFIPSITMAMGIRLQNGIEFGLGPNLLFGGNNLVSSSLVVGVGKSFNYGGVSIPLNLVLASNPSGKRISMIFGYAITK